jgi:hypothetical protein
MAVELGNESNDGPTGVKHFDLEFESDSQPEVVLQECLATWTGQLAANGYLLVAQSKTTVTYHRKHRHWAVILLAIVFFPIGLLALLITGDATITATVEGRGVGGSALGITGKAPRDVRQGFEELRV